MSIKATTEWGPYYIDGEAQEGNGTDDCKFIAIPSGYAYALVPLTGNGMNINLATPTLIPDSTTRRISVLSENKLSFYSNKVPLDSGIRLFKE